MKITGELVHSGTSTGTTVAPSEVSIFVARSNASIVSAVAPDGSSDSLTIPIRIPSMPSAAVAAGLVDIALGADEAGSVRIPSAWCGLVGMKATHGLVPSYGMTYMDHTIDHIGPMTTTVADNALMLELMAGSDWRDP